MSDIDDHQRLLQILEAHGQQFLDSFEQPSEPSSGKRKPEESGYSSISGEEDEEWHGFGNGNAGLGDSEDEGSIDSFQGASHHLMPDNEKCLWTKRIVRRSSPTKMLHQLADHQL